MWALWALYLTKILQAFEKKSLQNIFPTDLADELGHTAWPRRVG